MTNSIPHVLGMPTSIQRMKAGIDTLAELLAVTLGPSQGMVLNSAEKDGMPEALSDSATIARRVLELPDKGEDVGAMLLRNLVWRVHQRIGDGGAIAAVLTQAMFNRAARYVMAGANPVMIGHGIREATQVALTALEEMAQPVTDIEDLTAVALAVTGEPELSFLLGEMYDILGEHAYITIEDYVAPYFERVYIDGSRWEAKLASAHFETSPVTHQAVLREPHIALCDGELSSVDEISPLLDLVAIEKPPNLLVLAGSINSDVRNALVYAHQNCDLNIAAVTLKRGGLKQRSDFDDLSVLTGAELFSKERGRTLISTMKEDLGHAQRVEAGLNELFVVGGGGDPVAIREQIEIFGKLMQGTPFDSQDLKEYQLRLARMSGSSAVLKIGAHTKTERTILHQRAEQGVKAMMATLEEGVLPGGGTAYAHCAGSIAAMEASDEEQGMGFKAVMHALKTPFERILHNAGVETPGVILEQVLSREPGDVYDVRRRQILPARDAGVLDPHMVLRIALETAASGARMALSTDTMVLRRKPESSYEP